MIKKIQTSNKDIYAYMLHNTCNNESKKSVLPIHPCESSNFRTKQMKLIEFFSSPSPPEQMLPLFLPIFTKYKQPIIVSIVYVLKHFLVVSRFRINFHMKTKINWCVSQQTKTKIILGEIKTKKLIRIIFVDSKTIETGKLQTFT